MHEQQQPAKKILALTVVQCITSVFSQLRVGDSSDQLLRKQAAKSWQQTLLLYGACSDYIQMVLCSYLRETSEFDLNAE